MPDPSTCDECNRATTDLEDGRCIVCRDKHEEAGRDE